MNCSRGISEFRRSFTFSASAPDRLRPCHGYPASRLSLVSVTIKAVIIFHFHSQVSRMHWKTITRLNHSVFVWDNKLLIFWFSWLIPISMQFYNHRMNLSKWSLFSILLFLFHCNLSMHYHDWNVWHDVLFNKIEFSPFQIGGNANRCGGTNLNLWLLIFHLGKTHWHWQPRSTRLKLVFWTWEIKWKPSMPNWLFVVQSATSWSNRSP